MKLIFPKVERCFQFSFGMYFLCADICYYVLLRKKIVDEAQEFCCCCCSYFQTMHVCLHEKKFCQNYCL